LTTLRRLALGLLAAGTLGSCAPPPLAPLAPHDDRFGAPYESERRTLLEAVNRARAETGVRPLTYDALLEVVGTLHCRRLLADGVAGHFALDGVPPYARYLLAGGHGYHRENAASRTSSYDVRPDEIRAVLLESLDRMLSEVPPADGHRKTLLDPDVTHIGVGIAYDGGEIRVAHEIAVEVTTAWRSAPAVARPQQRLGVGGRLTEPWEVAAVEVLWQPLPRPMTPAQVERISSYGYPPRRSITYSNQASLGRFATGDSAGLEVHGKRGFYFTWVTGPEAGLEVIVVWARATPGQRSLTPVAASCTVVTADGIMPPALASWAALNRAPAATE